MLSLLQRSMTASGVGMPVPVGNRERTGTQTKYVEKADRCTENINTRRCVAPFQMLSRTLRYYFCCFPVSSSVSVLVCSPVEN